MWFQGAIPVIPLCVSVIALSSYKENELEEELLLEIFLFFSPHFMIFNSCTLPVLPLTGIKLRSQKKSVKSGKKKTTNEQKKKKKPAVGHVFFLCVHI